MDRTAVIGTGATAQVQPRGPVDFKTPPLMNDAVIALVQSVAMPALKKMLEESGCYHLAR